MIDVDQFATVAYLLAGILFIMGIKGLTHPRTAVRGNMMSAIAMLIAVVVTFFYLDVISLPLILAGIALGSLIGAILAVKIQMTGMPQLVAIFNGFGGAASALVAGSEVARASGADLGVQVLVAIGFSGLIGALTFTGSLLAFSKLQGLLWEKPTSLPGHHAFTITFGLAAIAAIVMLVAGVQITWVYIALVVIAMILGILLVNPIGGADMPVVIALLNSYSGLAACATGFVLNNTILIVAGSLVGASGLILTKIMCKAMNRSFMNVMIGGVGGDTGMSGDEMYAGKIKSTGGDEVAMILEGARKVVIIPGYGMAVAQAQHAVRNMMKLLEARGVEVLFGIHPVAGRMPGHMNVLLAEASIPYDMMLDMGQINSEMEQIDVAIVLGANDTVNPLAREPEGNPIAGMPIIDADKARTCIVIKRSLSHGFAGMPNPLFANENTLMFFADGRQAIVEINTALEEL